MSGNYWITFTDRVKSLVVYRFNWGVCVSPLWTRIKQDWRSVLHVPVQWSPANFLLPRANLPHVSVMLLGCKAQRDCPLVCPLLYSPICATNSKGESLTFSNECLLRTKNCVDRTGASSANDNDIIWGASRRGPQISQYNWEGFATPHSPPSLKLIVG